MHSELDFRDFVEHANSQVEQFVRRALGCACPDEVFEHIRLTSGPGILGEADIVVEIGGRLLVVFARYECLEPFTEEVPKVLSAAVAHRDSNGFNRMRLVLSNTITRGHRSFIEMILEQYDERVHVHYL